jgi:ATP-dependent DNA ligase
MRSTFEFCIPTAGKVVPSGPDWLHEVKYDGYRLRVERDGDRVRLFSRNGYDWTSRYPWIVESARKIRQPRFVLDGEAVASPRGPARQRPVITRAGPNHSPLSP